MTCFSNWSPLVVVVVEDDEALVGVLEGRISNTIRDSVRVKDVSSSDVLEGRAIFLNDFLNLVDLYFDRGQGRGARGWGWGCKGRCDGKG